MKSWLREKKIAKSEKFSKVEETIPKYKIQNSEVFRGKIPELNRGREDS